MRIFGLEVTEARSRPVLKIERRALPLSPIQDGRGGWHPLVREPYAGAWQRNQELRTDTALTHPTLYSCVTLITGDIGKLRPKLVQFDEVAGIWRETRNTAHSPVLRRPNRFQNHKQFQAWWITSKLLNGNTYVLKERDDRNVVRALYILDPLRVTVLIAPDGDVFYQLKRDDLSGQPEETVAVPASEIVHDRFNCLFHPLVGTSPIFAAAGPANIGLQIQRNSTAFFANGSNLSGVLASPTSITKEKAKELTEIWNSHARGGLSGFVAVLGDGLKFEPMRMSALDAQLIEQLGWSDEKIASVLHVPPFKIGVGAPPTHQNGQILEMAYYTGCLQRLIEDYEECMDEALELTSPMEGGRRLGVELDLDGLLRMDTATQVDTLVKGIRGGLYTPNGARRKVDEPPLVGGDTIYMQHQDYPIEKVYNRTDLDAAPESEPAEPVTEAVIADEPPEAERAARLKRRAGRRARTLRIRMMAR